MLTIFVPRVGSPFAQLVAPKSGIVGDPEKVVQGRIRVHYEGAIYRQTMNFADRVAHAAGRLEQDYPTVAQAIAKLDDLIPVGNWDDQRGTVIVSDTNALRYWLELPSPDDLAPELLARGYRYEMRRLGVDPDASPHVQQRQMLEYIARHPQAAQTAYPSER